MDIEVELQKLATQRTWRLFGGALLLVLSAVTLGVAWSLGTLEALDHAVHSANPTPEQMTQSLFSGLKWGLGIGSVFFVSGVVLLGMGFACDLRLKRFQRELDDIAGPKPERSSALPQGS
jgi:hypothetical protein